MVESIRYTYRSQSNLKTGRGCLLQWLNCSWNQVIGPMYSLLFLK